MAVFSAIPWFKVVERYPLSGEERSFKRRDLRRGTPQPCQLPPPPPPPSRCQIFPPDFPLLSCGLLRAGLGKPLTCRNRATSESMTNSFTLIVLSALLGLHNPLAAVTWHISSMNWSASGSPHACRSLPANTDQQDGCTRWFLIERGRARGAPDCSSVHANPKSWPGTTSDQAQPVKISVNVPQICSSPAVRCAPSRAMVRTLTNAFTLNRLKPRSPPVSTYESVSYRCHSQSGIWLPRTSVSAQGATWATARWWRTGEYDCTWHGASRWAARAATPSFWLRRACCSPTPCCPPPTGPASGTPPCTAVAAAVRTAHRLEHPLRGEAAGALHICRAHHHT